MKQGQEYVSVCKGGCMSIYIKTYLFKYYYVSMEKSMKKEILGQKY